MTIFTKLLPTFGSIEVQPKLGKDQRYHMVYAIQFENGEFYIGKHSTIDNDLTNDKYFASGKLPTERKARGIPYQRENLFFFESSEDALAYETTLLESEIYDDPLCLNCYPGSPPDATGTVCVFKGEKFKMVNPKLVDIYLSKGWKFGTPHRQFLSRGNSLCTALESEIDDLIKEGWELGNARSRGRIFIMNVNTGERRYVHKTVVGSFGEEWTTKNAHNIAGRKVMKSPCGKLKRVFPDQIEEHLENGWVFSSTVGGKIPMRRGHEHTRIDADSLDEYLAQGWETGGNSKGTVYISNGSVEKRIPAEADLADYPGFTKGRITTVRLVNKSSGQTKSFLLIFDDEEVMSKLISALKSHEWYLPNNYYTSNDWKMRELRREYFGKLMLAGLTQEDIISAQPPGLEIKNPIY